VRDWPALGFGREDLAINSTVSRSARSTVLEHLRALRGTIARARDTLMHFKDDRVDRDALEPAARRVDDLMNMFASSATDPELVALWSSEIQAAMDKVPNPKAADALLQARSEIAAILGVIEAEKTVPRAGIDPNPLRPFG
jgi:hypothetical protein